MMILVVVIGIIFAGYLFISQSNTGSIDTLTPQFQVRLCEERWRVQKTGRHQLEQVNNSVGVPRPMGTRST